MRVPPLLVTYPVALAIFFAIDMVWLGWLSGDLYERHIGHLLGPVNWLAALAFYLIFIAGIVIFSVRAGLETHSPRRAAIWGALYGFFTYATYDLTNMATLRGWSLTLVFVDIAWGIFICASVGFLTTAAIIKMSK
jgi:uncharacterized membrane protein